MWSAICLLWAVCLLFALLLYMSPHWYNAKLLDMKKLRIKQMSAVCSLFLYLQIWPYWYNAKMLNIRNVNDVSCLFTFICLYTSHLGQFYWVRQVTERISLLLNVSFDSSLIKVNSHWGDQLIFSVSDAIPSQRTVLRGTANERLRVVMMIISFKLRKSRKWEARDRQEREGRWNQFHR